MRDCRLRPDACGEDITTTDRNEWKLKAELFLAEELSEQKKKDAAAANKKKWYRVATSDLAWGTERHFQVMLGHGMIALATKGEGVVVPEHILDRQRVTISWDMGPDNLCLYILPPFQEGIPCECVLLTASQSTAMHVGRSGPRWAVQHCIRGQRGSELLSRPI